MKIRLIGANHETADVSLRETLSLTETQKIKLMDELMALDIKEAVLVSTCGRFELYVADRKEAVNVSNEAIIAFLETFYDQSGLKSHFYIKEEAEAVSHLFKVASGLDSAVLGEDQILGQVKESAQFAMTVGSSGKVLNRLFLDASTSAKALKATLKISEHPLSLSYIAVKKAKSILGDLSGRTVLMIGLGKMGQLALKTLLDEGIETLYCAVRHASKVDDVLLADQRLKVVNFDDRYDFVEKADIVIGATAAPHTILHAHLVDKVKAGAVFLDLALPRDFDPALKDHFDIQLFDVDDLKDISEDNVKRRKELSLLAEEILKGDVEKYLLWMHQAQVDHVIHKWHEDIELIHGETLEYLTRKLPEVSPREMALIDKMLEASLKRFIRKPMTALKHMADSEKREQAVKILEELFADEDEA